MKKILGFALVLALCLSLSVPALAVSVENRFPDKQTYRGFTDVLERDWFYSAVNTCYRVGLMNGTNAGFQPNKVLTAGEVAAIAARIHATVNDAVLPAPSTDPSLPWYQHSMDYLSGLGVSLPDGAKNATRLEFVQMLSAVLTDELLEPINTITALPDTSDAAVLRFYNAGILTGVDDYGTFSGGKTLTRAECAAMVSRIVRTAQRQSFTPADARSFQAAGMEPATVLFSLDGRTVTAREFLPLVMERIRFLEGQCKGGYMDFNWNNLHGDLTYREDVLQYAMDHLDVSERIGTAAYQNFDVQVFYSTLIDLRGGAPL